MRLGEKPKGVSGVPRSTVTSIGSWRDRPPAASAGRAATARAAIAEVARMIILPGAHDRLAAPTPRQSHIALAIAIDLQLDSLSQTEGPCAMLERTRRNLLAFAALAAFGAASIGEAAAQPKPL